MNKKNLAHNIEKLGEKKSIVNKKRITMYIEEKEKKTCMHIRLTVILKNCHRIFDFRVKKVATYQKKIPKILLTVAIKYMGSYMKKIFGSIRVHTFDDYMSYNHAITLGILFFR